MVFLEINVKWIYITGNINVRLFHHIRFFHLFLESPSFSDDFDVVNTCEVIPSISDDELDHNEGGGLGNLDWLLGLDLSSTSLKLLWLTDDGEVVSIDGLASLDFDFLHAWSKELDFFDNSCLLECDGQFLWVHSCCDPHLVWLSVNRRIIRTKELWLTLWARWMGWTSHRTKWRK